MTLAPRIGLRQSQSLAMTPQLQQAIKLLQLNNLALAEFVAAEVEKNPLLEYAAIPGGAPAPRIRSSSGGDVDDGLESIGAQVSLAEHLHAQIGAARAEAATAEAAHLLADELEEDGYLRMPLPEVALRHRLSAGEALRGLALLQDCDPVGVGARSLSECLELQLRERDRLDPAMRTLLDNLELVARGRTAELRTLCGVDAEDFADMMGELRALDPKPGLRFARGMVQVAVPDVYVTPASGGGWTVELNAETLPRVLVNNRYAARVRGAEAAARRYVSEMSLSANWLVRSLEQRARTILKVAGELARHQEGFFSDGPRLLRPLTQRIVADRLGLHESTVSRVTADKFLACSHGTLPLRYFFSASIPAAGGGDAFSAVAVQDRIRTLIGQEPSEGPLSDDRIVAVLHAEGISIARRTVAKYREAMNIPSSVERRRRKTVLSGV